jgi:transcriptional regulator with XRE-family HTH domain
MELSKIIGQNLKEYRKSFGYTQDNLANFLGVDRSAISHYENAEREISIVHLNKIADLFGIELEELLESDKKNNTVNLAFAFRSQGTTDEDIASIAAFQKVVKNYIKMQKISNGQD